MGVDVSAIFRQTRKVNLLAFALLLLLSCNSNHDNNSIRPINTIDGIEYSLDEFYAIGVPNEVYHQGTNQAMNISFLDIAVHLVHGDLKLVEANLDSHSFYELSDGILESKRTGEVRGEISFTPSDSTLEKQKVFRGWADFIFEFNGKMYFIMGSAHGSDQGGTLFELTRENGAFSYTQILDLDSAPEAMAIYKNKILIAGHTMFMVIENFQKTNTFSTPFWRGLYPNSIAVKDEDEVYVGMRGGYAKLSLNTKVVEYFVHKTILQKVPD